MYVYNHSYRKKNVIKELKNKENILRGNKRAKGMHNNLCNYFNDGDLKGVDISQKITAFLCS